MPGLKIVLPISFSGAGASLPILKDDPLLNAGSMLLIEPAHPANPITGVPALGSTFPNIASQFSAPLLGSSASAPGGSFLGSSLWTDGTHGRIERTTKGGIHGIASQATAGGWRYIRFDPSVINYVKANPGHAYYASIWMRITRKRNSVSGFPYWLGIATTGAQDTSQLFSAQTGFRPLAGDARRLGFLEPGFDSVQTSPQLAAIGANGVAGNLASTAIDNVFAGLAWGARGAAEAASGLTAQAPSTEILTSLSFVFYRMYLEDLTVSGRNFAQALAADQTVFAAASGVGGRYNGDTIPTAVATIP